MSSKRIGRKLSHYRLICECLTEMLRTRRALLHRPFDETAKRLNLPLKTTHSPAEQERLVRQVRAALGVIRRRIPWSTTCLVRAVAVHQVLARRKVASNLVLSVTPASGKTVDAHAWLVAGGVVVTGEREKARYVPIYTFSNAVLNDAGDGRPAVPRESAQSCSH
jgi:hypothetical protein